MKTLSPPLIGRTLLERTVGYRLFRRRGFIFAPIFLVAGFCPWGRTPELFLHSLAAAGLLGAGLVLRMWAIRYMGRSNRTRRAKARSLVTAGPFAQSRNPLYLTNLFGVAGFVLLSGLDWFVAPAVALAFFWYDRIARWEELVLTEHFGSAYAEYRRLIPRWGFAGRIGTGHELSSPRCTWTQALWLERNAWIGGAAVAAAILLLRQRFWWDFICRWLG